MKSMCPKTQTWLQTTRMPKRFCLLLIFGLPAVVCASELPYSGAWKGVIGKSKVQVCFSSSSNYYYSKHLRGIELIPDESAPTFSRWREKTPKPMQAERELTGTWDISQSAQGVLEGTWTDPARTKKLDIRLTKVAEVANDSDSSEYAPCGKEFHRPIEDFIRYTFASAKYEKYPYREIQTASGDAFEIPSTSPGAKTFNAFVHSWLKRQAIDSYYCELNGGKDWHKELRPLAWTAKYLVVFENLPMIYCGGGRNTWSSDYFTVNLQSGEKIDTWSWIKEGRKSVERAGKYEEKLPLRVLIEKASPRQECGGLDYININKPYPTKRGLVFPFSGELSCETDAVIPYKSLRPYLTPTGTTAVKEFAGR
jgi:hypothetical protein